MGKEFIRMLKKKIANCIQNKLNLWMINLTKEQTKIGETLY